MSWEPTRTPRGYMTQVIGNAYPYWHAGRVKYGGRTQRVINSLGGFALTEIMQKIRRFRANMFLNYVDLSEPYKVWTAPRPVARSEQANSRNLLQNPSLSFALPYRNGPWNWGTQLSSATGSWSMQPEKGLFGYYAFRMASDSGETVEITQTQKLRIELGQKFTVTIWYAGMAAVRDPQPTSRSTGPYLEVTTTYADATTLVTKKYLRDDTAGAWRRDYITITPTDEVYSVQVKVVCDPYNTDSVAIDVGGLQMEYGDRSTEFTEHQDEEGALYLSYDPTSYTEDAGAGSITFSRSKRIRILDDFDYSNLLLSLPSRATVSAASTEVSVTQNVLDAYVDDVGNQWSVGWRIAANYIERYNADTNQDEVWNTLQIADLFGDHTTDVLYSAPSGVTQTYEALTVVGEWLYVIVKEVYAGNTQRILKICSPYIKWDDADYLESVADVYIDDGTGTCNSVGVVQGRSDQLILDIDSTDYLVQLEWDTAARNNNGMVILRTDPGTCRLVG